MSTMLPMNFKFSNNNVRNYKRIKKLKCNKNSGTLPLNKSIFVNEKENFLYVLNIQRTTYTTMHGSRTTQL